MFYLLIGEIALAVILTVLAIAILAILIARWTRRRHNEARVCRYASEQSAGLLDHEDGISRGRHKRGRGSRCSFSSDSGPTGVSVGGKSVSHHSLGPTGVSVGGKSVSHHSLGLCRSNPAVCQEPQTICQGTPSKTRSAKSLSEPLTGNAGEISGTIGPIMQFSAPIPGATGPIKLSQKTFLQTPGPIVQCMDSSAVIPVDICCQPPSMKPSCFQQLSLKPSCCQPCNPCNQCGACQQALMPSYQPESTVPILLTQRTGTKRGPPIILKKQSDCKGQMIRHGGSVSFQDPCGNPLKCCKAWRRCQCEHCSPKRREQPIWCEEAAPSTPPQQQQQQQQQHPPRRQDSQVRFDQRSESELGTQPICYEEPFLFRRLESLIRKNQDGIVIKQNEGGFLIQKAGEPHRETQREPHREAQREPHREAHRESQREPPPERRQSGKRSSKKSSQPQETDSDSSAPQNAEADSPAPAEQAPSEENLSEGDGKKRKKEKKKKKKKDG
ncbi:testis-expressed basic protein 1 isoform X7 [Arvicanthis niloticus]|uniref:testis-expressed basic protein 1 isoform X7 n=1 Tax=Arvicanthis niloticus TaxID=61156 RepID=UPI00402BD9C0